MPKPRNAPDAALAFVVRLAHATALVNARIERALSGRHGLGFGEFVVLHHLSGAPALRLRRVDLAHRVALTPSGVTRLLQPLEKRGIVSRESDPHDARSAFACLTKAGQRLHDDAQESVREVAAALTQSLAGDELAACAALFDRLAGVPLAGG